MIPATTQRVHRFTRQSVNDTIHERTRENVSRFASASPRVIDQRLRELDHEWDVERITAVWVAVGFLAGLGLAALLGPIWLLAPAALALLLLVHAVVGWCPTLPLIRRQGFRTESEIAYERYALKALRGDFQRLDVVTTPQDREDLSRFEDEGGPPAPERERDASDPEIVNEAMRAARA